MKDLFPLLILVVLALISKVAAMAKPTSDSTSRRPPSAPPPGADDGGYAERTRRIQEEIRRKIAERRSASASPASQPPPLAEARRIPVPPLPAGTVPPLDPFGGRRARPVRAFEFEAPAPEPPPVSAQATAEQASQQELVAQLAAIKAARVTAQAAGDSHATVSGWADATRTMSGVSAWRKDLRSPADLRRAIALREVLGPPVALR